MSPPIKDKHGLRRSKSIAFRVSPEEDYEIGIIVAASGMTKQDFITSMLKDHTLIVKLNVRVFKLLRPYLLDIYRELRTIQVSEDMDDRSLNSLELLSLICAGVAGEGKAARSINDDKCADRVREPRPSEAPYQRPWQRGRLIDLLPASPKGREPTWASRPDGLPKLDRFSGREVA